jgi:hypothetical protein
MCTATCSFYIPTSLMFAHNDIGTLLVKVTTASGQTAFENITFVVDDHTSAPVVDSAQSLNISGTYIGFHSQIRVQADENMSRICANLLGQTALTCTTNTSYLDWTPPYYSLTHNITLFINATDQHGNSAVSFIPLRYVHQSGSIENLSFKLSAPGAIHLNTSSEVPITIHLDGLFNQTTNNQTFFINQEGRFVVNATIYDAIGYSRTQSISIILDTNAPSYTTDLSTKQYLGFMSEINLTAIGTYSNISTIVLTLADGQYNCSTTNTANDMTINLTIEIEEIFHPACQISKLANFQASIMISIQNEVGRFAIHNSTIPYFGTHQMSVLAGSNFMVTANNQVYASSFTSVWCENSHPVPTSLNQQAIGGNSTVNNLGQIQWISGNGVIRCDYVDILGNTKNQTWAITFINNDLTMNYTLLNSSGNITKYGEENIQFQIGGTGAIGNVSLHIDGQYASRIYQNNGKISLNESDGYHSVSIMIISQLGYTLNTSMDLWLDSQSPTIDGNNGSDYTVDFSSGLLYVPHKSVTASFQHADAICGNQTVLNAMGGSILSTSQQTTLVLIPSNSTQISITVSDCVGWERVKTFTIHRVNSVRIPVISNISSIIGLSNTTLLIANNGTFDFGFTSPLIHEITCSVDVGGVACNEVRENVWSVELTMINTNATLLVEIENSIGMNTILEYQINVDLEQPQCFTNAYLFNGIIYGTSSTSITIQCDDLVAGLDFFNVGHGAVNITGSSGQNLSIALQHSTPLTIYSSDKLGNVYTHVYDVTIDDSAPELSCSIGQSELSQNEVMYLSESANVHCEAEDEVRYSMEFSTILLTNNTSQPLANESSFSDDINFHLPLRSHETQIRIVVYVTDELGTSQVQSFDIEYDTILPTLEVTNMNHLGVLIESREIFATNGTYRLHVTDTLQVNTIVKISCELGSITNTSFHTTVDIFSNYDEVLSCGSYALVNVTSQDQAGNHMDEQFTVYLDSDHPVLSVTSNELCPLDIGNLTILLHTCPLSFIASDDSPEEVMISVITSEANYGTVADIFEFDLGDLPPDEEISIIVTLTDAVGHQTATIIRVMIQPDLVLGLSQESCLQTNLSCIENSDLGYDALVMGQIFIDISIPGERKQQALSNKLVYACPIDQSTECIELNTFPTTLDLQVDGYWSLRYSGRDSLSRMYQGYLTLLVDTDKVGVLSEIPNHYSNDGDLLICETCNVTYELMVEHKPVIETNIRNFSLTQLNQYKWELVLFLDNGSTPRSDPTIVLNIRTASGMSTILERQFEYVGEVNFEPFVSGLRCNDNPAALLRSSKSPDYLCTYATNEINAETTSINLEIRVDSSHNLTYSFDFTECFRSSNDACTNSSRGPFSQMSSFHDMKLKQESKGIWMEYEITIYLDKEVKPRSITVAFLDREAFDSTVNVDLEKSSVIVQESGRVEVNITLNIDASFAGHEDLDTQSYLDQLVDSMETGTCQLSGNSYDITNKTLHPAELIMVNTAKVDCKLTVRQVDQNTFLLTSNLDWSNISGLSPSGNSGIFHLFQSEIFQIDYVQPIVELNAIPIQLKGEYIEVTSPEEYHDDAKFSLNICSKIMDSKEKHLDKKLDSTDLQNCLMSITSNDGIFMLGVEVVFTTSSDETTIRALCRGVLPGNFMNEWLDASDLNQNEKCEQLEIDRAVTDREYLKIEMKIIVCDLRCKISAEKIAAEENIQPKYIDHASTLEGFSVETQNLKFETPSGDWFWSLIAILILGVTIPIVILFVILDAERIAYIKKLYKIIIKRLRFAVSVI